MQIKGQAVYAIDYYANHGHGLEHYANVLEDRRRERGYRYARPVGPHDLLQHDKLRGQTYAQYAREFGLEFQVLPLAAVETGIEMVRGLIPRMFFDRRRCARWVEALESYTKKWNDALKVWGDTPRHDWASHPADMTRYLAQAEKAGLLMQQRRRGTAEPWVDLPGVVWGQR